MECRWLSLTSSVQPGLSTSFLLPDQFPQDPDSDLSSEVMAFKSQLCLAQTQECILEKSLLGCRKPGIVTKVCGQVVDYYKQAVKQLEMSGPGR